MKKSPAFIVALLATALLATASPRPFTATVVADSSVENRSGATYLALDGGLIEGGDSIGGETPPAAEVVRRAVEQAAATAGLTPVAGDGSPAVVLTYHWGAIRPDSTPKARVFRIESNLRSRIALVASASTLRKAEDYFRGPRPPYTEPDLRDAFELAHGAHYFVIVSAYDEEALARHQTKLLWRVRVSALTNSGSMDEVVPALAAASAPYFGRNLSRPETIKLSPVNTANSQPSSPAAATSQPTIDEFLRTLLRNEHEEFSGERDPSDR
jgi:hypothetical protein